MSRPSAPSIPDDLRRAALAVLLVALAACSRDGPDLNSIPATYAGGLRVQPEGRTTGELYLALTRLGPAYGFTADGDGATGGRQWVVRYRCRDHYVGTVMTAAGGDVLMFQLTPYAFANPADYDRFRDALLDAIRPLGTFTPETRTPPLAPDDLRARGRHMKLDVTSTCAPPTK